MYQYIKNLADSPSESVHFLMFPTPDNSLIDVNIERAVSRMQSVIELGRVVRDRKTIPIKYPLPEVIVVHQDPQYIQDILSLQNYILSELNVRKISTTTDKSKFGITLRAEPDHKVLGLRLKQEFKAVTQEIKALTDQEINEMVSKGYREICGQRIEIDEVRLIFKSESLNTDQYEVNSDNDVLILMDITPDSSMQDEGTAREIINRIQKLRKKAHLVPTDEITVFYKTEGDLDRVAAEYQDFIESTIKASLVPLQKKKASDQVIIEETQKLKDCSLYIALTRKNTVKLPSVRWVNVQLVGLQSRYCNGSTRGMILLELRDRTLSIEIFKNEVARLFGVSNFLVLRGDGTPIMEMRMLLATSGNTVFITPRGRPVTLPESSSIVPFCRFANFTLDGTPGTMLLENPEGIPLIFDDDAEVELKAMWQRKG